MSGQPSKKLRQIYDNVYGYIDFSRTDFDFVLKDPFFLRLHNLKQMGLAYYVYPDALHTRYAHSLGVYTNVCKIIDSQSRFSLPPKVDDNDKYKIKLSALLHDIGHLPLSHAIERALDWFDEYEQKEKRKIGKEQISTKPLLKEQEEDKQRKEPYDNASTNPVKITPKVALHEKLGEAVLLNCDIGQQLARLSISPLEIAAGFKGDIAYAYQQEYGDENTFYSSQIRNFLHSQLDADRIDYLRRDSSFSGVNTGSVDIDKLLNSIVYDNQNNYGVESSAIRALDQFFISRYVAYCQIVGNKKVMAFEYMASDFYFRLLKLRSEQKYHLRIRLYSYQDLVQDILPNNRDEFLTFTDDYFFSLVREVKANKSNVSRQDKMVVLYAEMLTNGQALLPVTYIEGFEDSIKDTDHNNCCFIEYLYDESLKATSTILEEIANSASMEISDIIIPEPMKITIYKDDEDPVQIFKDDRTIAFRRVSESPASLLRMLKDKKYCIYRIYTIDSDKRDNLRKALANFVKDKEFRNKGDLE